jgi:hypothetical protein
MRVIDIRLYNSMFATMHEAMDEVACAGELARKYCAHVTAGNLQWTSGCMLFSSLRSQRTGSSSECRRSVDQIVTPSTHPKSILRVYRNPSAKCQVDPNDVTNMRGAMD